MSIEIRVPALPESVADATIIKWHKKAGDQIKMDETLLEIATDKVDSEVPSTAEGVVEEVLFNVNDVVPIGTVIARINTQGNNQQSAMSNEQTESSKPATKTEGENYSQAQNNLQQSSASAEATNYKPQTTNSSNRFYSPLVLNIAAQEGISMVELENIPGTGAEGRVSKRDILQYVSDKRAGRTAASSGPQATSQNKQQEMVIPMEKVEQKGEQQQNNQLTTYTGNVEIIEMDRMRKLIADHMVRSKHTSPHVTSFTEADVTNMVMWRDKVKKEFEKREGTKITFTPLFIEAVVRHRHMLPHRHCICWMNLPSK